MIEKIGSRVFESSLAGKFEVECGLWSLGTGIRETWIHRAYREDETGDLVRDIEQGHLSMKDIEPHQSAISMAMAYLDDRSNSLALLTSMLASCRTSLEPLPRTFICGPTCQSSIMTTRSSCTGLYMITKLIAQGRLCTMGRGHLSSALTRSGDVDPMGA